MDASMLAQVESLATVIFTSRSNAERAQAEAQLAPLQGVDFLPQCEFILEHSSQVYAQQFAASSMESAMTAAWNQLPLPQKQDLRVFLLRVLRDKAHSLAHFVLLQVAKLCGRAVKLGWFDANEFRADVLPALESLLSGGSLDHRLAGLQLALALVEEMNSPTTGRTLTAHRKTAVSFRDTLLLQLLQCGLTTLRAMVPALASPSLAHALSVKEQRVSELCVTLICACFSFDFIGTNPEESAEDVGTVQVPSSWRAVVQDPATMSLLFEVYSCTEPPRSQRALEALVQLSSVRRSLFASESERTIFLTALMQQIHKIFQSKKGLEHDENYHEFCRLLGRLKANYQLSELVKIAGFNEWLELAGEFTVQSLRNWETSMNSIHYLLALWGRLVAALPYLRTDSPETQRPAQRLREVVLRVTESYMTTMLDSVNVVVDSDGGVDDPLCDDSSLKEQMERLPGIAKLQYDAAAQFLLSQFQQVFSVYEQSLTAGSHSAETKRNIAICEGRLTWLVHMVAACIEAQSTSDSLRRATSELVLDGQLSRWVFNLAVALDNRLNNTQGAGKCDEKLELAVLCFFKAFKKCYLLDSASAGLAALSSPSAVAVPGGSAAHPLLSMALASYRGGADEAESAEVVSIYDAMNMGDMITVMNLLVTKLCNNIKFYHRQERVLEETLEVFIELISSYSSSKTLLALDAVNFLVNNHTGQYFPFLGYDSDNKFRINFYSALTRLVFSSAEDINNSFDTFVAPNLSILQQLSQTSELRSPGARVAIIGALRDLRGITVSAYSKRTYNLLFDALYPVYFPLFRRVTETYCNDPVVMTAMLKFLQEFVSNKGQRIFFENSSANGILLFRETSAILYEYGSRILSSPVQQSVYVEKYKGIRLLFNVLSNALAGNYVNFGVFKLYQDPALQNAFDVSLQLIQQIPLSEVLAYVKFSRAYFTYLELLFRNHLDMLAESGGDAFLQIVKYAQEAVQTTELTVSASCASIIDHFATYMFLNFNRDKPTVNLLRSYLQREPELFTSLLGTLFNVLLFGSQANHWAITRPMLSLMLVSEGSFAELQQQMLGTQPVENHEKLRDEFVKLSTDMQRSVETSNRDKFTQKLTVFRLNVRQFLAL